MDGNKGIKQAEKEFKEITASCFIYLRSNGLRSEFIQDLLMRTLYQTIHEIDQIIEWNKPEKN